ncbi:ArsR/SmtB family transcription factor [Streptomyces albus]|uniref:ArsR/SmtB family transcription factor n=1 Tax=Streptomyces TaxID=1883 RepID=UPI0005255AAC|nr:MULTISPECIES: winged helix-turn-helix domain-containing protein [Streptomyces]KPC90709.1 ArsR family transcriptional regulator [Streptomyces sp. NRRL F-6602]QID34454.1 winged helix-turn-helix transcriptional regulator [Streptomyces albus]
MRIHFTVSDLARVRVAEAPSALATTTFSAFRLRHGRGGPALDMWRRTTYAARHSAAAATAARPGAAPLSRLAATTPSHPVPRLLRPQPALPTLDEEIERLLSTPRAELRADLEYVARHRPLPRWAGSLAEGDPAALRRLADAIRVHHKAAVAPYWRGLHAALRADQAERCRQWQEGGVERVLSTLHPRMRWRPPVLELPDVEGPDYHLDGRGLVLAPAAFTSYVPCDPGDPQPTLHYEAVPHPGCTTTDGTSMPLAALLGHSRAAVLEVVAEGVSTGRLARRTGLSPASASEHATVLRRAGLVTTHRVGRTVHHTLTPLGAQLLLRSSSSGTEEERPPRLGSPSR